MKKLLPILILLIISTTAAWSQNYMRSFGVRASNGFYFSYRHAYKENMAVEAFLGYQDRGVRLIGMREFFVPALKQYSDNFKFVYGFGVHAGVSYTNKFKVLYREYKRENYEYTPIFGLDGFAGIEYQVPELPIMFALNLKPFFEFSTSQYYKIDIIDPSFTLRFCF